jgi:hypothetical protein
MAQRGSTHYILPELSLIQLALALSFGVIASRQKRIRQDFAFRDTHGKFWGATREERDRGRMMLGLNGMGKGKLFAASGRITCLFPQFSSSEINGFI